MKINENTIASVQTAPNPVAFWLHLFIVFSLTRQGQPDFSRWISSG